MTIQELKANSSPWNYRLLSFFGAMVLKGKFRIPAIIGPIPIGIRNTDELVMNVSSLMGVPDTAGAGVREGTRVGHPRMTDAHIHFYAKSAAIFGDPDVAKACSASGSMGMNPVFALTGTPDKKFAEEVKVVPECEAMIGDTFLLHQKIKNHPVDVLILETPTASSSPRPGYTPSKIGFPITDRANLHYFPIVGYAGAARLVEMIGNTLLERRDRDSDDANFEMVL